jgi:phage terminase large subunit-like protein
LFGWKVLLLIGGSLLEKDSGQPEMAEVNRLKLRGVCLQVKPGGQKALIISAISTNTEHDAPLMPIPI